MMKSFHKKSYVKMSGDNNDRTKGLSFNKK